MASDEGLQNVTIRFHRPVDSEIVNKRFKDIRVLGIHKGGYLSKTGGDNVSLSPLVCEISDGTHQVRIETTAAVAKTLTELSPYLILNWEYTGVEATDYMEISVSSLPDANDIIIGKGVFVASALSIIDYSERTTPDTHHLFLHVEQTETPGSSIRVRSGVGHASSVHYPIIDQVINISASSGQTVYVYVNDTGGVTHSVTAANYAGKALLAKIVYPADGIIENSDIEDVRSFITAPAIPDGESIERNSSGKLQVKDRTQHLSTFNQGIQLVATGAFQKANLGTIKNQEGIAVNSHQITLTANRKYALSYGIQGQPTASSVSDPQVIAKWVVVSGDSSWSLEEISLAGGECTYANRVTTPFSTTCYIIPSVETVVELQIFTENSSQKSQVVLVTTNIMSVD